MALDWLLTRLGGDCGESAPQTPRNADRDNHKPQEGSVSFPTRLQSNTIRDGYDHRNKIVRLIFKASQRFACKTDQFLLVFGDDNKEEARRAFSITFAIGNLLFAALYYCIKYHSTGTINPSWTELFG